MTRKPSAKLKFNIDPSMKADVPNADVKGMKASSMKIISIPQKEFKATHKAGATHGIINGGQPPKKFPVNRQGQ